MGFYKFLPSYAPPLWLRMADRLLTLILRSAYVQFHIVQASPITQIRPHTQPAPAGIPCQARGLQRTPRPIQRTVLFGPNKLGG